MPLFCLNAFESLGECEFGCGFRPFWPKIRITNSPTPLNRCLPRTIILFDWSIKMTLSSRIKKNAKLALASNWVKAGAIFVSISCLWLMLSDFESQMISRIFSADLSQVIDFKNLSATSLDTARYLSVSFLFTFVFMLLSFFLCAPLLLGVTRWFFEITDSGNASLSSVLVYFSKAKSFFHSIMLNIELICRTCLYQLLFSLLPALVVGGGVILPKYFEAITPELRTIIVSIGIVFFVMAQIYYFIFIQRYFLAPYLVAADKGHRFSCDKHLSRSVKLMKGRCASVAIFKLSFSLWGLLSLLIVPLFFVYPYYNTSLAIYAKYIIEISGSGGEPAQAN